MLCPHTLLKKYDDSVNAQEDDTQYVLLKGSFQPSWHGQRGNHIFSEGGESTFHEVRWP